MQIVIRVDDDDKQIVHGLYNELSISHCVQF